MDTEKSHSALRKVSPLICAAGTLLGALFWLNNLVSAYRYHAALWLGRVTGEIPAGIFRMLSWSAVDVSTVTTFIPFFGFLLMWRGVYRVRQEESWPFFPGYDRLNVALGLLGTLWGIILIGYYPSDRVTIPALMSCLHTAMFSTLAAILWVMVLEPLLFRPWMNALQRDRANEVPNPAQWDEWLEKITLQLKDSGSALEETGKSAAALCRELAALHGELTREREAGAAFSRSMTECCRSLAGTAAGFQADRERLTAENGELSRLNGELERRERELSILNETLASRNGELERSNGDLTRKAGELESRNGELTRRNDDLTRRSSDLESRNGELERRSSELENSNGELLNANEALERQRVESERRSSELAASLKTAQEELARIKANLEAVRAALR